MHVYQSPHTRHSVVVVGSGGVIGSALRRTLSHAGYTQTASLSVNWSQAAQDISKEISVLLRRAITIFPATSDSLSEQPVLSVIWAAGAAGFNSTPRETEKELSIFRAVLNQLRSNQVQSGQQADLRFLLISSIGGLFEGITNITLDTPISVRRPYGQLKIAQEELLAEQDWLSYGIVRLTSVYSYINPSKRMGLIQMMVHNALLRCTTTIFGSPSTLRDYVWADDVGRAVVRLCMASSFSDKPYHLFSGRPTSIMEVHSHLERALRRPVHLSFNYHKDNALNICGSRMSYDGIWQPTYLTENITRMINHMLLRKTSSEN